MINSSDVTILSHSDVNWTPIDLQSNYNGLSVKQQSVSLYNKVTATTSTIFENAKDVKINQSSIVILADKKSVNSIFKEQKKEVSSKLLLNTSALFLVNSKKNTTTKYTRSNYTNTSNTILNDPSDYEIKYLSTKNNIFTFKSTTIFSNTEIFKFQFNDDYVKISDYNNLFLTLRDTDSRDPFLCLLEELLDDSQKFNYILNEVGIVLFRYNTNFTEVLTFNINLNNIYIQNIDKDFDIPDNATLYIDTFKTKLDSQSIVNSFVAKYDNITNSIELDSSIANLEYKQNYIVNIPYSSVSQKHTAYINSLKNYQTPTYEYNINDTNLSNREYTSIFTGHNQKTGYNNIYLNYTANTVEKIFQADTAVTFHYPATTSTEGITLNDAGLIESGAIAGHCPFTSDRISYSRRDYRELNIPSVSSVISDNTWLYSWLSAGPDNNSVWVDRFHKGADYIENFDITLYKVNDPLFVDEPSTMLLLPNRIYTYFHQGQSNIKAYIDGFANIDRDGTTKLLDIKAWDNIEVSDLSIHNNTGKIIGEYDLTQDYFNATGSNYVVFPASKSLSENTQLTIGFWCKINDINLIRGAQLFGNFADGGVGLFNTQKEITPVVTLIDTQGIVHNYNSNFEKINQQTITSPSSAAIFISKMANGNYWTVSSDTLQAKSFDYNNNQLILADLTKHIVSVDQVEIDNLENIYIVDNIQKIVLVLNGYTGGVINTFSISNNSNRIEIVYNYTGDLKSDVVFKNYDTKTCAIQVSGKHSTTDIYNNIWSATGATLYKNNIVYGTFNNVFLIAADAIGYLWVIHGNKLTKIDIQTDKFIYTKTVFKNTSLKTGSFITQNLNTYLSVIDQENACISLIDSNGDIYTTYNIDYNTNIKGDYTGYNFQQKFKSQQDFLWKIYVTESSGLESTTNGRVMYLPFNVKGSLNRWRYYSFVFDHAGGSMSAYVDGEIVNTSYFNSLYPQPFRFKIKPSSKSYTIGAYTSKQSITTIYNNNNTAIYNIARLHIYKNSLNNINIKYLFNGTYINMYNDMIWNISVGDRNYIEQIDKFFMQKMPGNKSNFFNLKIKNLSANPVQQKIIEQAINNIIPSIMPANTTLNKIKWI